MRSSGWSMCCVINNQGYDVQEYIWVIADGLWAARTLWNSEQGGYGSDYLLTAMQSSSEVIMERSKPVGGELVVSTSATVDLTPGGHGELLQSAAISLSLKSSSSPTPVDCELEEADNPNAGLEQALQSFVRYVRWSSWFYWSIN